MAVHARDRAATTKGLVDLTLALVKLAKPTEAAVLVNGRPDVARATSAQGVQLRTHDLSPADARAVMPQGIIGVSVHTVEEGRKAVAGGAEFLLAGTIFSSGSHPGREPAGLGLIEQLSRLPCPVIAIGGITADRVPQVRDAGAYGVAAIGALWRAPDPAAATAAFLDCWS